MVKAQVRVTRQLACKVRDVVKKGLVCGMGDPVPGRMCVEAAVCYAMGIEHGDDPPCVGAVVRSLKISLNDSSWSSDKARAKGMRKVAIAQLGSNRINQRKFADHVVTETFRVIVPQLLVRFNQRELANECKVIGTKSDAVELMRNIWLKMKIADGTSIVHPKNKMISLIHCIFDHAKKEVVPVCMQEQVVDWCVSLTKQAHYLVSSKRRNHFLLVMADICLEGLKKSPGYKYLDIL